MKHHYLAKLLLLLLFAAFGFPSGAYAQTGSVSGRVTDAKNEGIPGATVLIDGTSLGSSSNVDGTYSIQNVPAGAQTLVFSFVGYNSVRLPVTVVAGQNAEVSTSLSENTTQLSEAVVVGYGTQRRQDVTGAIATINSKQFVQGQVTNPEQLIQGKTPGVVITSGGGAPGSGTTIRIRGGSSLNASNDPLIIIDGVPVDNSELKGASNPLSLVNPNDIETFTVLKDASATAIYGSRASNGVILITTKKGLQGEKLTVNVNSQTSLSRRYNSVDVLSADEYRATVAQVNPSQVPLLGTANTDWQSELFRTARTYDNNVSLTGSVGKLPFRASYGNLNQEGILITNKLVRNSGSLNLSPVLFDNSLRVDLNLKGSIIDNNFADVAAVGSALAFNPTQPVRTGDENLYGGYFQYLQGPGGPPQQNVPTNPVGQLLQTRDRSTVKRSIGNLQLDYKLPFLPDLRANLNLGYDITRSNGSKFVQGNAANSYFRTALDPANTTSRGGEQSFTAQDRDNKLLEFYLNYSKQFSDSRLEVLGGYSYQDFVINEPAFANLLADGSVFSLAAPNPFNSQYTLISFYGRANYSIKDRYIFTGTFRGDGTSRFPQNKFGYFPAGSFAWRLKGEDFLKDNNAITDLKLRLGYGITGQQDVFALAGNYPAIQRNVLNTPTAQVQIGTAPDGTPIFVTPYSPKGFNSDLKWESTTTYNGGLDFGFLDGRLGGTVDVYYRKTTDLLANVTVSALTNYSNQVLRNIGTLENRGIEFNLNASPVRSETWNLDLNANATYNQNKITSLGAEGTVYSVAGVSGGTGTNIGIYSVGSPSTAYYVRQQVYGPDGRPLNDVYVDRNGDGVSNDQDLYVYKQAAPPVILGFSSNLSYKQVNLAFTVRSNLGSYVYNNINSQNGNYQGINGSTNFLGNVTRDATYTNFPNTSQARYLSDYYIQNGSFLRMENVTLGYNAGKLLGEKANLRLTFAVQNVFLITKYTGLDPEINIGGLSPGVDNNIYPRPRAFTFGLNLSI
jgi:iron complex outermembrane receptor protein